MDITVPLHQSQAAVLEHDNNRCITKLSIDNAQALEFSINEQSLNATLDTGNIHRGARMGNARKGDPRRLQVVTKAEIKSVKQALLLPLTNAQPSRIRTASSLLLPPSSLDIRET